MVVFNRWQRLEVSNSESWRNQVAYCFGLKSDIWMPTTWARGEFELIAEGSEADQTLDQGRQKPQQAEKAQGSQNVEEESGEEEKEHPQTKSGLITVYFGVATARAEKNPHWRNMIASQVSIEGFLWFTKEDLPEWREGQYHAIV
jgi:hypothetical protein